MTNRKFLNTMIVLVMAFAIGRLLITPRLTNIPTIEGTYEALVHIFVGFLIIVPFYDKHQELGPARLYGWLGWGLAFWELAAFIAQKAGH